MLIKYANMTGKTSYNTTLRIEDQKIIIQKKYIAMFI